MTTTKNKNEEGTCPAQNLLKLLAGKWKPEIFSLAQAGSLRFNSLLRDLPGSNKQSLSTALKELEEVGLLNREVVSEKPLHVEYNLSDKGKELIPIFRQLEQL